MKRFFALIFLCVLSQAYGTDSERIVFYEQTDATEDSFTRPQVTDKTHLEPLDYQNLFSKPNIEWGNIANKKSGIFIGLNAALIPVLLAESNAQDLFQANYPIAYGYDFKLGIMYFSNPYVGFRIYTQYSTMQAKKDYKSVGSEILREYGIDIYSIGVNVLFDTNLGQNYDHAVSVVIDLSISPKIDFTSRWLAKNGESGRDFFSSGNKTSLGIGLGYVYRSKHRIEVIFRRFTDIREGVDSFFGSQNDSPVIFQQMLSTSLGYSYVF